MRKWKEISHENRIDIVAMSIITGVIGVIFICVYSAFSTYEVEVTYCDEREPKVIEVDAIKDPCQKDIRTNEGVPTYAGEIYVCSIKTLRKISD